MYFSSTAKINFAKWHVYFSFLVQKQTVLLCSLEILLFCSFDLTCWIFTNFFYRDKIKKKKKKKKKKRKKEKIQQIQKIKYEYNIIIQHWVFVQLSLILQQWKWQNLCVIMIEWLFFKTSRKQKVWGRK